MRNDFGKIVCDIELGFDPNEAGENREIHAVLETVWSLLATLGRLFDLVLHKKLIDYLGWRLPIARGLTNVASNSELIDTSFPAIV